MVVAQIAPQRILMLGAGVIGSVYAVWLQNQGHDVTLWARGQRLAEIQTAGVIIEEAQTQQRQTCFLPTVDHLAPTDMYDLLIVAIRLEQLAAVLPAIVANRQITTVLLLLNNATTIEAIAQQLGPERVVVGFPGIGGDKQGPVITYYVIPQQPTTLGLVSSPTGERLQYITALMRQTGHAVTVTPQMPAWLQAHAVFVTCLSAAIWQAGGDSVTLAGQRGAVRQLVRAIREGFIALQAQQIAIQPPNLHLLFLRMPAWFAVWYWQRALRGPMGTLAMAPHVRHAHDEMALLAQQVRDLTQHRVRMTPTMTRLLAALDAPLMPLADGSTTI